jgi:hypothetical protein
MMIRRKRLHCDHSNVATAAATVAATVARPLRVLVMARPSVLSDMQLDMATLLYGNHVITW